MSLKGLLGLALPSRLCAPWQLCGDQPCSGHPPLSLVLFFLALLRICFVILLKVGPSDGEAQSRTSSYLSNRTPSRSCLFKAVTQSLEADRAAVALEGSAGAVH